MVEGRNVTTIFAPVKHAGPKPVKKPDGPETPAPAGSAAAPVAPAVKHKGSEAAPAGQAP